MNIHTRILVTYLGFLCWNQISNADHPRDQYHVPLSGQSNFRDLGGYRTETGQLVKPGLIYRSGHLGDLSDSDVEALKKLKIQTVFNFLTDIETKDRGKDRIPQNAREVALPIDTEGGLAKIINLARQTGDFTRLPPDINPQIHRLLVNEAKTEYGQLFKQISSEQTPVVFHCSHGIHRTGTAAAILLWTLGVPWETIRGDYLLSNDCRQEEVTKRLDQLKEITAKSQNVPEDQVDMTNIKAFYILQGSYIDATRDELLNQYGSLESYLEKALKLEQQDIQRLRDRLLE